MVAVGDEIRHRIHRIERNLRDRVHQRLLAVTLILLAVRADEVQWLGVGEGTDPFWIRDS
jgi:hypothetical protein